MRSKGFFIFRYVFGIVLGLIGSIAYYVLYDDYIKGEWYPTIGAFISSHGLLFGTIAHLILRIKRIKEWYHM